MCRNGESGVYYQVRDTNVRLLGTLHVFPHDRPKMPAWVTEAYTWSKALVFESDPPSLLPYFKSCDGSKLHSVMPSSMFNALKTFWPTVGPLVPLDDLKPWGAVIGCAMMLQSTSAGVETQFMGTIEADGKMLSYLEDAIEITPAFDTAPLLDIQKSLEQLLADRSAPQRALERMYDAWFARD